MMYNPQIHHRGSIRLRGYDYSQQGSYFITICTQNHECRLGKIVEGKMYWTFGGWIAYQAWIEIPQHFEHVELDQFIVMPNHIHGIIVINNISTNKEQLTTPELWKIVAYYKYKTTKLINEIDDALGSRVWQRNYYDRIIRNEQELSATRQYIINNPANSSKDQNNPHHQNPLIS
ncbi:transposase [Brunnivagina elsteri CCALA 953]|uniref:Transposase n=2 Tax=Brunnivagina TaxID=3344733 RepID=A0A2A2THJ4_9CYAN|nr:transposase [Calothrix elsteri CCALA 953]